MLQAEQALQELVGVVDTVIVIPNERLMETVEPGTSFFDAFRIADDILRQAVQGISDIITVPGIINRDFADVRTIMHGQGLRGYGHGGRQRFKPGGGRCQSRHFQSVTRRQFHSGRAGNPHQYLRQLFALACKKSTKLPA